MPVRIFIEWMDFLVELFIQKMTAFETAFFIRRINK